MPSPVNLVVLYTIKLEYLWNPSPAHQKKAQNTNIYTNTTHFPYIQHIFQILCLRNS